jgi:hypothetical protein
MRVDQSWHQRCASEIDYLRACRMIDTGSDSLDAIALNQNLTGLNDVPGIYLQKPRGVQHDCGLLLLSGYQTRREGQK